MAAPVFLEETADGVVLRTAAQAVAHAQALARKFGGTRAEASVEAFLAQRPPGQRRVSEIVLDASALLADAPTTSPAGRKVADGHCLPARIGVINMPRWSPTFIRLGHARARPSDTMLDPLPMTVVARRQGAGQQAARLRVATAEAGLSLGDRFCLALSPARRPST
jgi:PIN domain nuclease of toxin-antitoxin system